MSTSRFSLQALAVLALVAWTAVAGAQPKTTDGVITDEKGMSLYVWDNDLTAPGKSVCNGACSMSFPPMLAKEGAKAAGDHAFILRDDGQQQWTYKNRPLYRWANDSKPGDSLGDGMRGGSWHLAKP